LKVKIKNKKPLINFTLDKKAGLNFRLIHKTPKKNILRNFYKTTIFIIEHSQIKKKVHSGHQLITALISADLQMRGIHATARDDLFSALYFSVCF